MISTENTLDSMAPRLDQDRLSSFKKEFCDENDLIGPILAGELRPYLRAPILDVGAGLGDIALGAFPDMPAILLDVENLTAPISPQHKRVTADFFDYVTTRPQEVGTALFIHVLQYIDDDVQALRAAIEALAPANIVTVTNDNTGKFGELVEWASENIPLVNAERHIDIENASSYRLTKSRPFTAMMSYPNFSSMADDLLTVILDVPSDETWRSAIEAKLKMIIASPQLEIHQTVRYYERHGE